ncbi:MAG: GNAT family N-acetyltransferase [Clostridiales bacterium]|nr:GNAT family N-acetyltransferase [Clostridiales bacterium]
MNKIKFYNFLPKEAKSIREKVFINEQGFKNEFDGFDNKSIHLILYYNGIAAGTARMFTENSGKSFHIGRVAVLPEYRNLHLGAEIVNAACNKAKEKGAEYCELSAQCRIKKFYCLLGFKESGEIYLDESCPHIHMEKELK